MAQDCLVIQGPHPLIVDAVFGESSVTYDLLNKVLFSLKSLSLSRNSLDLIKVAHFP